MSLHQCPLTNASLTNVPLLMALSIMSLPQSTIHMSGFRNLSDGEAVEFACRQGERGLETTIVTGPGGAPCKGSQKTDSSKTRLRKKK